LCVFLSFFFGFQKWDNINREEEEEEGTVVKPKTEGIEQ